MQIKKKRLITFVCIGLAGWSIMAERPFTSNPPGAQNPPPVLSNTSSVQLPVNNTITVLGQNKRAKIAAWLTTALVGALGVAGLYVTVHSLFDSVMQTIPLLQDYRGEIVRVASGTVTLPIAVVATMKWSPEVWYACYILYSGERMSPLLARNVLHDIKIYVQHLSTIKAVERDLQVAIDQINMLSGNSGADNKKNIRVQLIDPHILQKLHELINADEAHIQHVLEQLQEYLSEAEIESYVASMGVKHKAASFADELFAQAQDLVDHLKGFSMDLGKDAKILTELVEGLVVYWQEYTQSLAAVIDADLVFCKEIHALEQFMANWLERALLCV